MTEIWVITAQTESGDHYVLGYFPRELNFAEICSLFSWEIFEENGEKVLLVTYEQHKLELQEIPAAFLDAENIKTI